MKIEYVENGSDDCPLIRIYGPEPAVCQQLWQVFESLAQGHVEAVSLTELPGMEPVAGCCLIAQVGQRDRGVLRQGGNAFSWLLTPATWDNVAGLIQPFCGSEAGEFHWLDQVPASEARILLSTSPFGCW
jgi:hypothetical protein